MHGWGSEKNEQLGLERGVSFEQMVVAVEAGGLLDILAHPNQAKYPNQRVLVVASDGYAYLCLSSSTKTISSSRPSSRAGRQREIIWTKVVKMPKTDSYETELVSAFEKGALKSVATKAELSRLKASARATAIKDRRVNIRLSSGDLQDIQVKALQEGMPYQTLIASVLHKYVTGRLTERGTEASPRNARQGKPATRRAAKTDA